MTSSEQPSSFQQRLVEKVSDMDDKVDNFYLATTLQGLTLGDNLKQNIDL